jgi:hypothetical protein
MSCCERDTAVVALFLLVLVDVFHNSADSPSRSTGSSNSIYILFCMAEKRDERSVNSKLMKENIGHKLPTISLFCTPFQSMVCI